MFLLVRVLIALAMAALFAWPVLIGLRTGQIRIREWIVKRLDEPLIYWAMVAFNLSLVIAFIAIGLAILLGYF
jgi:uncharacterized protein with PQ loop repeat